MYLPLKWRIIVSVFLLLNITEVLTVSLVQDTPALANLTQYEESYFRLDQISPDPQPLSNLSPGPPGPSAAASNWGGIVRWENNTQRFTWRKKRQTVGRTAQCSK